MLSSDDGDEGVELRPVGVGGNQEEEARSELPAAAASSSNANEEMQTDNLCDMVLPIFGTSVFYTFERETVLPILPIFVQSFTSSPSAIGVAVAAYSAGRVIGGLPSGAFNGHCGSKLTLMLSCCLEGVAALMLMGADSVSVLALARFISGVSMSCFNIARGTFVAQKASDEIRGKTTATLGGIRRMCAFAAPIVGGYMAEFVGHRSVFAFQLVLVGLTALWALVFVPMSAGANARP